MGICLCGKFIPLCSIAWVAVVISITGLDTRSQRNVRFFELEFEENFSDIFLRSATCSFLLGFNCKRSLRTLT